MRNLVAISLLLSWAVCSAQTRKPYEHKYAQISRTYFNQHKLRMEGSLATDKSKVREAVFTCDTSDSTCVTPVLNTSYLLEDSSHYKCKNAYTLSPVDEENGNEIPICLVSVK